MSIIVIDSIAVAAAMTPSNVKPMEPRFEKGYTIPLLETRLHMFYIGRCHGRRDRERVY